jgi:dipeptidyl aminopeptidase/acylaminoacyl peptidase
VPKTTEVVAITGSEDDNTFPALAQDYVARLEARGLPARFVPVEGAGHGFSALADAARRAAGELLGK